MASQLARSAHGMPVPVGCQYEASVVQDIMKRMNDFWEFFDKEKSIHTCTGDFVAVGDGSSDDSDADGEFEYTRNRETAPFCALYGHRCSYRIRDIVYADEQ